MIADDQNINFTPRLQKLLQYCKQLAVELGSKQVTPEHLFVCFFRLRNFRSAEILFEAGFNLEAFDVHFKESLIKKLKKINDVDVGSVTVSKNLKKIISNSVDLAQELGHTWVSADHVFLAYFKDLKLIPEDIYMFLGVDMQYVNSKVFAYLKDDEVPAADASEQEEVDEVLSAVKKVVQNQVELKTLDQYAINLTKKAIEEQLDPVFGRQEETRKLEDILNRRKKNNAIIVGEAGVGKTAIVEGLVQNIVQGKSSVFLNGKVFYEINLSTILAGTKYRGEFEQRMKKIVKEAQSGNVILFIDEIHTLVGAGDAEGGLDAANIFKPALANGSITVIGATTYKEYRQRIVKDKALQRRFEAVMVNEPSRQETKRILDKKKALYEEYHGVILSEEIIENILDYSERYLTDLKFPDKAIDLMDLTCSHVKVDKVVKPKAISQMEEKLSKALLSDSNPEEQQSIYDSLSKSVEKWGKSIQKKKHKITKKDLVHVLSIKTNIPEQEFLKSESKKYLSLESKVKSEIIGQDNAVDTIVKCLMRHKSGLRDIDRPIGSFLCLGTTGVGKTFLAKTVAKHFFGSKNNFIHLDMSEFSEEASITKLIGSSPGYVGHEQGGLLIEKVYSNSHSLILFDEIEKAHPKIHQMLLQILDEGRLTDSQGRVANFNNAIIMVTGNIGSFELSNTCKIGFNKSNEESDAKDSALKELKKRMPLELINRFDDVLFFNKLSDDNLKLIIKHEIKRVKDYAKESGISLSYPPSVINFIFNKITDREFGARSIRRIIQKQISDVISTEIVANPDVTSFKIKYNKKTGVIELEK